MADAPVAAVTGANGFIGSHLVERLLSEGYQVRALCHYNSRGSFGWLEDAASSHATGLQIMMGDVCDPDSVTDLMSGAVVVFHLAALISIPYSYEAPRAFVETNIGGTLNVLQGARHLGTPRVIVASTSEVYGTPATLPITEAHPLQGQSPYSASKIAADKICEAWALSYSVPVITVRPFNTYGPRQSLRAVIPTILTQLINGQTELRLGALHPRRDFTFVSDTVDGFVRAARSRLEPGEVVQLGTGHTISIADLVSEAAGILGVDVTTVQDAPRLRPTASEVQVLQSDPTRAARRLGWRPLVPLREGLEQTLYWLRHHGARDYSRSFLFK